MREIDPRSRYSRRTFLKGAASAGPAAAIVAGTGLSVTDAWAEDAQALTAPQLKTLVKMHQPDEREAARRRHQQVRLGA